MSDTLIFVLTVTAVVIVSYMIGNINWATIFAMTQGVDIHNKDSGNPGTMNMLRNFGFKLAFATLVLDLVKGLAPTLAAYYIIQALPGGLPAWFGISASAPAVLGYWVGGVGKAAMLIGGLPAVLGHCFPVVSKFRGGKGVATAFGVYLAMNPIITFSLFLVGLVYLCLHKYSFVSSFIVVLGGSVTEIVLGAVYGDNILTIILPIVIAIVIVVCHRENLRRLVKGEERDSNLIRMAKRRKAKHAAETAPAVGAVSDVTGESAAVGEDVPAADGTPDAADESAEASQDE